MTAAAKPTLAEALVAFQAEAPPIALDATNPHFKSKFASLGGVMNTVRPVLAKNGLAVIQLPTCAGTAENPLPALRTVLLHSSGEREEDVMLLSIDKPGPQAHGSALTYARRYAVLAILGLVGEEDDDGNAAKPEAEQKKTSEFKAPTPKNGDVTKKLAAVTKKLLDGGHITQEQLDAAAKDAQPADLLGRLERFAETVEAAA